MRASGKGTALLLLTVFIALAGQVWLVHQLRSRLSSETLAFNASLVLFGAGSLALLLLWRWRRHLLQEGMERGRNSAVSSEQAIDKLLGEIRPLAHGDLAARASVDQPGTATLATALNCLITDLDWLAGSVLDTATRMVSLAKRYSGGDAALRTPVLPPDGQLHDLSNDITGLGTSLSVSVGHVEECAHQARQLSVNAASLRQMDQDHVERLVRSRESLARQAVQLKRLGEDVLELQRSRDALAELKERCRLLSLNGAIAADEANPLSGEAGSAADTIDELARHLAELSASVESLTRRMSQDASEAAGMGSEIDEALARRIQSGGRIQADLDTIRTEARRVEGALEEQNRRALHHAAIVKHLTADLATLDGSGTSTGNSPQPTRTLAHELQALASELRASVSGYRLSPESGVERRQSPRPVSRQRQSPRLRTHGGS